MKRSDLNHRDVKPNDVLICENCDAQYSADARDYWMMHPEDEFTCECGNALALARVIQRYRVVAR